MTDHERSDAERAVAAWHELCARLRTALLYNAEAHALAHTGNEVIGELQAEIARIKAEKDLPSPPDHQTVMSPQNYAEQGMEQCRGMEPGTVFRTTDTHREWILTEDHRWTPKE